MNIRFGTSGWRAIIADEFTFENVWLVTQSICAYLREADISEGQVLIVGHDSRFMGEQFAAECAKIAEQNGFNVLLCENPTPTPTISHAIRSRKAVGGINFTASHNPPEYSGIKFSTADGAPALPEITKRIEAFIENFAKNGIPASGTDKGGIEIHQPKEDYLNDLLSKVNFEIIANAGGRYGYDPLWGTGRGYLDESLRSHGLEVTTIHNWRDVTFGGRSPEPDEKHLDQLRQVVIEKNCTLGLSTDGDGDRFGILDTDGTFITPNQLIAILTDYLAESRGWTEGVARSVATSHLVDRVAENRGLKLYETAVGFKYIGELINQNAIILGGEESAGLSIKGHYPEKDGILACLLAAEAVAARQSSLSEQLNELYKRVGRIESGRIGVRLTPEIKAILPEKLKQEPESIGGRKIEKINRIDGVKFIFTDKTWILMRPSGTEPLVRVYAEAETTNDLEVLLEQGRQYLLN
jgi:phosphoglucomutase